MEITYYFWIRLLLQWWLVTTAVEVNISKCSNKVRFGNVCFFRDEMSPVVVRFWSVRFSSEWEGTSRQYSDNNSGMVGEAKK